MSKIITRELDLDGRKLKLETGKLARLADASVMASWGETVVLVTVATKPTVEPLGYFPLSVEYVEKYYAGGRITAQRFIKREARPSEGAVLCGRMIDRSIRPLFPKDFYNEVQVVVTVLSFDGENDPAILGLIGTSAALSVSSLPWNGPLGATKLGEKDGKFLFNPILPELEHLDLDLTTVSTADKVVMIEAEGKQAADEVVLEGIKQAHQHSQALVSLIEDFAKEAGRQKQPYTPLAEDVNQAILEEAKKLAREKIEAALFDAEHPWHEATGELIKADLVARFAEKLTSQQVMTVFDKAAKELMQETVLIKGQRVDGRAMDQIREISIETGVLPRTHGSAIFQRGDTQVLSVATLGPLSASQTLESMAGETQKRFMHHYNMSINPFSVGEVKRIGAPNRRDIGHGALVEKSLSRLLPSEEEFPYAVRVVSEVLAANASTSMASVCASTLALLNAGVAVTPVAGIALGLLSDETKFQVITDMRAVEDFYGEMDFKVCGTKNGITAIQMDTKLAGLSFEIIATALNQGKKAREEILDRINQAAPRVEELSKYAPKIEVIHIKPEEIGLLIGTGGKNINGIIASTGAQIDIEDDGTVMISSANEEAIKKAVAAVEGMFKRVEVGEVYEGKVVKIAPFGAFVELVPGKDGLVHVSQMATYRVERPEDVVQVGQTVKVRVSEVGHDGKIGLSMLFGEQQGEDGRRPRPDFQRKELAHFSSRRSFGSRGFPKDRFGAKGRSGFDRRGGRRGGFDR